MGDWFSIPVLPLISYLILRNPYFSIHKMGPTFGYLNYMAVFTYSKGVRTNSLEEKKELQVYDLPEVTQQVTIRNHIRNQKTWHYQLISGLSFSKRHYTLFPPWNFSLVYTI